MSKDHTRDLVSCAAGEDSRIILIWAPENRGVMDAYFRGYRAAFDGGCEWILEMDGGFSHLPEQIPQFIAGMETGFDYVGGSRFMTGGCHASPWTRIFISKAGSVLANWLLKTRMTDMTSGFECFTRNAMSQVLKHGVTSKANFFQTEIRYRMHQFNWMEVPITYRNRNYSVGRSSLLEAIRVLWALYRAKPGD